ncbi:tripartite tricarboxylate transporter substrate binding protein [Verticiella sediminum]|uniref:Tripartite tricarboxylate transporter substrate binding protein n=1 Tax=Verticiella sediminum TaxID=1247510 RepID=A0A556APM1_9BURK|nr:tripartite tricarboxylate transporter substrate binding protein [Verticiella sediminum]TSH94842.1 tripartite tricarboxylate transporter substrate binding protein [Verticiella sediminum]
MQMQRRRLLAGLSAAGLLAAPLCRAMAAQADWPRQPLRLVLPFAAGGPTDVVARALALRAGEVLGQQILVENRTGASGNIATEYVARAAPDGYTALYHSSGLAITPALYQRLNFDPLEDFTPVGQVATIPAVLMVNPTLPVRTIQEFVEHLRANPNGLSYGTGGVGNITHLAVALFLQANELEAVHVPYKGTAPAMTDLIGGRTQFMLDAVSSALPYIQDDRVRALALTSQEPMPELPGVPTFDGSVMPGFVAPTWHAVMLPAGTPDAVVARWGEALAAAAEDPALVSQFAAQGVALQAPSSQQFGPYFAAELERWDQAARAAGIERE